MTDIQAEINDYAAKALAHAAAQPVQQQPVDEYRHEIESIGSGMDFISAGLGSGQCRWMAIARLTRQDGTTSLYVVNRVGAVRLARYATLIGGTVALIHTEELMVVETVAIASGKVIARTLAGPAGRAALVISPVSKRWARLYRSEGLDTYRIGRSRVGRLVAAEATDQVDPYFAPVASGGGARLIAVARPGRSGAWSW